MSEAPVRSASLGAREGVVHLLLDRDEREDLELDGAGDVLRRHHVERVAERDDERVAALLERKRLVALPEVGRRQVDERERRGEVLRQLQRLVPDVFRLGEQQLAGVDLAALHQVAVQRRPPRLLHRLLELLGGEHAARDEHGVEIGVELLLFGHGRKVEGKR